MVLTEARYFLRLESGARAGETVSIPPGGLTIGRRPENGLQLAESSVSGRHAELTVAAAGVTVKDLGSTNGTHVGGERLTGEQQLVHGDEVRFGNVRTAVVDRALLDEPAGAPGAGGRASDDAGRGEEVQTLAKERVATAGKRGKLGLVALVLLVAGGGAAAFFL